MEGLKAVKANGVQLGRPKGPGKSKLDEHKNAIIALLKTGVPKAKVARDYKASKVNLYNWFEKNGLIDKLRTEAKKTADYSAGQVKAALRLTDGAAGGNPV
jgi:DNA invertase Pin-like site-specific DNA recombinase